MASVRYVSCSTFCVCLCLFVLVKNSGATSKDDYFFYEIDAANDGIASHYLDIDEIDEVDNRYRRDVESTNQTSNDTKIVTPIISRGGNASSVPTPIVQNITSTVIQSIHNLGENGTGQRKNTTLPVMTLNATTSVNTAKNVTFNEDTEASPETFLDDQLIDSFDVPFEAPKNVTMKTDTHVFYNSTIFNDPEIGKSYWVNMTNRTDVIVNNLLSSSHRRAATIKLSFDFPFYGHYIKNVTVATGGFLYTGNYVHSWLAATQYVAPLMANFDTRLSNDSYIKFVDNGTAFTVEWDQVLLQDRPDGKFTFQTTLHKNGDIVFVYKNVPYQINNINDLFHPVKIGLSDAYIMDKTLYFIRRKTIYEYHRVAFKKEEIQNWTAIYLKALPTCLNFHNCSSCVNADTNLECKWCPTLNQCSKGLDRHRQSWIDKGCEKRNITESYKCDYIFAEKQYTSGNNYDIGHEITYDNDFIGMPNPRNKLGPSGYVAVIVFIIMACGFVCWTTYAYRNPHSTSGQMLIRYRPSQWRWRRGEARYTAATIHM